jgi:hypothetical protein
MVNAIVKRNNYVVSVKSGQPGHVLVRKGAIVTPGYGGHLIVTLNRQRSV